MHLRATHGLVRSSCGAASWSRLVLMLSHAAIALSIPRRRAQYDVAKTSSDAARLRCRQSWLHECSNKIAFARLFWLRHEVIAAASVCRQLAFRLIFDTGTVPRAPLLPATFSFVFILPWRRAIRVVLDPRAVDRSKRRLLQVSSIAINSSCSFETFAVASGPVFRGRRTGTVTVTGNADSAPWIPSSLRPRASN